MRTRPSEAGTAVIVAVSGVLLAACDSPPPPPERPAPAVPAPEAPAALAPANAAPVATATAAAAPVAVTPEGPAIASMHRARKNSKATVPVDLHYQLEGDVRSGGPLTLHLAAVPRAEGSNLQVSVKDGPGIVADGAALSEPAPKARTTYRQKVAVTRSADGPAELRVLVTMDRPDGSSFGWFGIPLDASAPAASQAPKLR